MPKSTPMDAQAASRIQSKGAKAGDAGKGSFAARAQSAAASNANAGQGGNPAGAASGSQKSAGKK